MEKGKIWDFFFPPSGSLRLAKARCWQSFAARPVVEQMRESLCESTRAPEGRSYHMVGSARFGGPPVPVPSTRTAQIRKCFDSIRMRL